MQLSTTQKPSANSAPESRLYVARHREVWPSVLPGLEELHARQDMHDWSIEQVRQMLDKGRWLLLMDRAHPQSFLLVSYEESPYHPTGMELFVLAAYHKSGRGIEEYQPHLEVVARSCGAQYVRFYSSRAGMLKLAVRAGYRPRSVEFVKELDHGVR